MNVLQPRVHTVDSRALLIGSQCYCMIYDDVYLSFIITYVQHMMMSISHSSSHINRSTAIYIRDTLQNHILIGLLLSTSGTLGTFANFLDLHLADSIPRVLTKIESAILAITLYCSLSLLIESLITFTRTVHQILFCLREK